MSAFNEVYSYKIISNASLLVNGSTPGNLGGIFVASTTGGTITIYDGIDNTGPILVSTFTPAAATMYPFPVNYNRLYVEIGGTLYGTVFFV